MCFRRAFAFSEFVHALQFGAAGRFEHLGKCSSTQKRTVQEGMW